MTKIILVRHCEARGNCDHVFQGHTDADISELGHSQLIALSERFKTVKIDAVYSSPLRRAMFTADAVNKYHGLPIHIDEDLIEINGGCVEGIRWSDLPKKYPVLAHNWNLAPWKFAPEGGEPMQEVFNRVRRAITRIAQSENQRTIAVVSHGCSIRNMLCSAHGFPIEKLNEIEWSDNTAVSVIQIDNKQNFSVISENDASHLDESISTFAKQDWWKKENRDKILFD